MGYIPAKLRDPHLSYAAPTTRALGLMMVVWGPLEVEGELESEVNKMRRVNNATSALYSAL